MIMSGEVIAVDDLAGFAAEWDGRLVGLATYRIQGDTCELISLDSLVEGHGIGGALLETAAATGRAAGCRRLILVTTNDNLNALGFYQKRGLRLKALRPGAVEAARALKPTIPLLGQDGIPIRDEIELEMMLTAELPGLLNHPQEVNTHRQQDDIFG